MRQKQLHLQWVDAAKGIAIIAVIIDHSVGILYSSRVLSLCTYFSVTVFVYLAGITAFFSSERHRDEKIRNELIRKVKSIILPYIIATFFYILVIENRWLFIEYFKHLLRFDVTSPFYFIVFFTQLIIISPYLYRIIIWTDKISGKMLQSVLVILSVGISILCIRHTFILDVYGGGKYIFGGSYLIVYVLGEISAYYAFPLKTEKSLCKILISFLAICVCVMWLAKCEFKIDLLLREPFGKGLNPPGITLMAYSGCIIVFLYYLFSYIEMCNIRFVKVFYSILCYVGRCSFYIFLYHKLVLDYFLVYLDISNIWIKRVVFMVAMLGIPIIIKVAIQKTSNVINNIRQELM